MDRAATLQEAFAENTICFPYKGYEDEEVRKSPSFPQLCVEKINETIDLAVLGAIEIGGMKGKFSSDKLRCEAVRCLPEKRKEHGCYRSVEKIQFESSDSNLEGSWRVHVENPGGKWRVVARREDEEKRCVQLFEGPEWSLNSLKPPVRGWKRMESCPASHAYGDGRPWISSFLNTTGEERGLIFPSTLT